MILWFVGGDKTTPGRLISNKYTKIQWHTWHFFPKNVTFKNYWEYKNILEVTLLWTLRICLRIIRAPLIASFNDKLRQRPLIRRFINLLIIGESCLCLSWLFKLILEIQKNNHRFVSIYSTDDSGFLIYWSVIWQNSVHLKDSDFVIMKLKAFEFSTWFEISTFKKNVKKVVPILYIICDRVS